MSKSLFFTTEDGLHYPEWEEKTLAEILELCQSGTSLNQNLYSKGLPVTRIETISSGKIDLSKVGYVDTTLSIEKHLLKVDDILFSNINSIEHIAKTAIVHSESPKLYHGMNLLLLRTNDDNSGQFVFHYLNTDRMRAYFRKIANKAISQASINQTAVSKTQLSVPSLAEQEKIAEFFSALDERIALTADKVKLLKEQKTGYLQQVFNRELVFTDANGDRYADWEQKKLGELGLWRKSYSYSRAFQGAGELRHIHYGDIHSVYSGVALTSSLPSLSIESADHELADDGDVIFADASEDSKDLGKALVLKNDIDEPFISGLHTHRFTSNLESLNPYFLLYFTQTPKYHDFMRKYGTGVSVLGISKTNLNLLPLPLPSLPEQEKIAEFFSALDEQIELTENKLTLLKEQKKGYLQGIFG